MSLDGVDQDRNPRWLASDDNPWRDSSERGAGWTTMKRSHAWRPPTDVVETDEAIMVQVEVAGMRGGEFSITFESEMLSIRGSRVDPRTGTDYHQLEIPFGDFAVDIKLPAAIDIEKIEAFYGDGFLKVTLPRAKPKRVEINS